MVRRQRGRWYWGVLATLGLVGTACTQAPPPAPPSHVPSAEASYLPTPLAGYPPAVDAERAESVRQAHARLDRDPAAAQAVAVALLAEDAAFHPASVLSAQVEFLRGEDRTVLDTLAPVVEALPAYVAAQLVRGRAAERLGENLLALRAYWAIAGLSDLASRRTTEFLHQELGVKEQLAQLENRLGQGRIENAEILLLELEEWFGEDHPYVLDGKLRKSRVVQKRAEVVPREELEFELELIGRLLAKEPMEGLSSSHLELQLRQADLELEVGDVRRGLEFFEKLAAELTAEDPNYQRVSEGLGRAKFRWRLKVLPLRVQELGQKKELDRADLATLLYWVVPSVRYSRVDNPPIANDILDHPQRDEIVRVVGLGLMDVDRTLHRFEPEQPATRRATLFALLRVLNMADAPGACQGDEGRPLRRSSVCKAAAGPGCRLIPEEKACRPGAAVSGLEARELFRRGLELLGSG